MASVNFHLRDNKSDKETPIILYLSHKGQRIKIATGERILPRNWNPLKQRAKKSATQAMSLNQFFKADGRTSNRNNQRAKGIRRCT